MPAPALPVDTAARASHPRWSPSRGLVPLAGGLAGVAVVLTALLGLLVAVAAPVGALDTAGQREHQLLRAIADERAAHGLPPVAYDPLLVITARMQAERIARSQSLWHNPNLLADTGRPRRAGENVAHAGSVAQAHDALLRSPRHRATVLGDWTHVGAASSVDSRGRVWVAQVFAQR